MNLPELVQPVLTCFEDPDARVRYYACESLYNISKVARGAVLVFFNDIFNGLCKVSSAIVSIRIIRMCMLKHVTITVYLLKSFKMHTHTYTLTHTLSHTHVHT